MAKKVVKETKTVSPKVTKTKTDAFAPQRKERQGMIDILRKKLLSKDQLLRGDDSVRHSREVGDYRVMLEEINAIGKEIGEAPIGFNSIRR